MQFITDQFGDSKKFWNFSLVVLLTFMINRCLASIIGTIFSKDNDFGIFIALLIIIKEVLFNNVILKIENSNLIFNILTEFDYLRYNFNSLLIIVYGLGRCSPGYRSKVLIEYDLEDEDNILNKYIYRLTFFVIFLTSIELIVFSLKSNLISMNSLKTKYKIKCSPNSSLNNSETDIEVNGYDFVQNNYQDYFDEKPKDREVMIRWSDLSYSVKKFPLRSESIKLLDNICGYFQTQSLNAVMGPSGAGKTTFLKCINGRITKGLSEESIISLNSRKRLKTCFIVQNISEHLMEGLTVRQNLLYASKLKNSQIIMNLTHNQNIEDLMSKLLISDISDNRVEKCSGGEQKRIVIASELTSYIKPNLLCIDEPTSGLDSNAAEHVSF